MGRNRSGDPVRLCSMAPATWLKGKQKHDLRQIMNIILWLLRTGVTGSSARWRNLPQEWPNQQAVYDFFGQWK